MSKPTPRPFLFRIGDGNEGDFPYCIIELKPKDCPYAALSALVINQYVPRGIVRRHIIHSIEIEPDLEGGVTATVYEGPDRETAMGCAWLTARLVALSPEDLTYWQEHHQTHALRDILDPAALRHYRAQAKA